MANKGELVQLKSGGPTMTVIAKEYSSELGYVVVTVIWFDTIGTLHQAQINDDFLILVT